MCGGGGGQSWPNWTQSTSCCPERLRKPTERVISGATDVQIMPRQ